MPGLTFNHHFRDKDFRFFYFTFCKENQEREIELNDSNTALAIMLNLWHGYFA